MPLSLPDRHLTEVGSHAADHREAGHRRLAGRPGRAVQAQALALPGGELGGHVGEIRVEPGRVWIRVREQSGLALAPAGRHLAAEHHASATVLDDERETIERQRSAGLRAALRGRDHLLARDAECAVLADHDQRLGPHVLVRAGLPLLRERDLREGRARRHLQVRDGDRRLLLEHARAVCEPPLAIHLHRARSAPAHALEAPRIQRGVRREVARVLRAEPGVDQPLHLRLANRRGRRGSRRRSLRRPGARRAPRRRRARRRPRRFAVRAATEEHGGAGREEQPAGGSDRAEIGTIHDHLTHEGTSKHSCSSPVIVIVRGLTGDHARG
jgi:hypothetical protein